MSASPETEGTSFWVNKGTSRLEIRSQLKETYSDLFTPEALAALSFLAGFNWEQKKVMAKRMQRRRDRFLNQRKLHFLDPWTHVAGTSIKVQEARDGRFVGADIPADLQRQWIQGTGPGAKPNTPVQKSIRNVAYALLSGADGWMFDGEDALGQITTMSLDNQRNLKLAICKEPVFLKTAEQVAEEMNAWSWGALQRKIIEDWDTQLDFTTKIFRVRGLHLDDRHIRFENGPALSASIVDLTLYVVNNYRALLEQNSSIVLYLPKIQTAEEAALWNELISLLEEHLHLSVGTIKVYVLVEQLEATFQLMEIRAALGEHFVGFNTGRWDYINSVADAMAWDSRFVHPNIECITMLYPYMNQYEDRVRRAVNTPDSDGRFALWQGGMEPNIPVGSMQGVKAGMERAVQAAAREQREGASGKWVAHWKMVHILRPVWEEAGKDNQLGRAFPPLTYTREDADALISHEPAPRTIRGARNLISVALQYGNAFGQGYQAAALKPADSFDDDGVLYLMEDMATGEIRLSILWEWLHKEATLTEDDRETELAAGDVFTADVFHRLLQEEYDKLLVAKNKDVHQASKKTTLPIAREIVETYVMSDTKLPWYIDLLNINLNNHDLGKARERILHYMETFLARGDRITKNLDFESPAALGSTPQSELTQFEEEVAATALWSATPRFRDIVRLYSPRQVVEQRGTIEKTYTIAAKASEEFYALLAERFANREQITTFGPYSPGQAVAMKRIGIEAIYLGGWATSAKGSATEDPGPDLASYPLSQVPNEAATLVRALLAADKNQQFARSRMTAEHRKATPRIDYRPFIIADADTGHGGDPHVRNLIQRFVEAGVPGYHIEDQKPGCKKCGHQGGKVLVPQDEQIKRLNAARFQLDSMKVPGIIVARTDAEAATLLDGRGDERDQPFILGARNVNLPSCKVAFLAVLRRFYEAGVREVRGHLLYQISDSAYEAACHWLELTGVMPFIDEQIRRLKEDRDADLEADLDQAMERFHSTWEIEAGLRTFGEAIAEVMEFQIDAGSQFEITVDEWRDFARGASFAEAREKARSMGISIIWDPELPRTPEGYYQVEGGIEFAIARSLAAAPFADLLWMETKTANLADAKQYANAIHAQYPTKMLAYNLSPSFNWDATGMSDEEMRDFPAELGRLGFVFNFITYGGHQIDGLAAEEFTTALKQDGMLALARLQRKLRLLDSPYKTPQSLVGGPRLDGALVASSGRTATTKAMGKGSTQHQHLVQTEVPPKLLEEWLEIWKEHYKIPDKLHVELLPHTAGSDLLELSVLDESKTKVADVIFAPIKDRKGTKILSIRDENTYHETFRHKRLMTLMHLFLIHRYNISSVHYVSPTEANRKQAERMKPAQVFDEVNTEVGQIIVAKVNTKHVQALLKPDRALLRTLISKGS